MGLRSRASTERPTSCRPGVPSRQIELDHVVAGLDVARVVRVKVLADESVDRGERAERVGDQALVADEEQPVRLLAINRLAQRVVGEAEHAGGGGKTLDSRIDRAARIVIEDARKLEGVTADEALDAVEDQAGLRTQQITLASGKSSTSAGNLVVQPRLVSKITVSGAASA